MGHALAIASSDEPFWADHTSDNMLQYSRWIFADCVGSERFLFPLFATGTVLRVNRRLDGFDSSVTSDRIAPT